MGDLVKNSTDRNGVGDDEEIVIVEMDGEVLGDGSVISEGFEDPLLAGDAFKLISIELEGDDIRRFDTLGPSEGCEDDITVVLLGVIDTVLNKIRSDTDGETAWDDVSLAEEETKTKELSDGVPVDKEVRELEAAELSNGEVEAAIEKEGDIVGDLFSNAESEFDGVTDIEDASWAGIDTVGSILEENVGRNDKDVIGIFVRDTLGDALKESDGAAVGEEI